MEKKEAHAHNNSFLFRAISFNIFYKQEESASCDA